MRDKGYIYDGGIIIGGGGYVTDVFLFAFL